MLKLQDYAALGGNVRADNIFVLRRKSSWANIGTLLEFVRSLSKILEPVGQTRHIILTLDACPVHLADRVVCQAQHIYALCACPHDRVAAAFGCLCLLALEKIFAEWPPQNSALTSNRTSKYFATGATRVRRRVAYYIRETLV